MLGAPTLKLRGDYLAIVTLGFGEIIRVFLNNLDHPVNITNGPKGISTSTAAQIFGGPRASRHWNCSASGAVRTPVLLLVPGAGRGRRVCATGWQDSRIGRAWMAIREDEVAAKAMGINTRNMKLLAFGMGATFGGVAGGLFAGFQGFVSARILHLLESVMIVCHGGAGRHGPPPGVVLGAVLLALLPEVLRYVASPLQALTGGRIDPESCASC
jgi:branched-chain amino acid transport system permease protein